MQTDHCSRQEPDHEAIHEVAMTWVRRIHDGALTSTEGTELAAWCSAAPAHAKAYAEAQQLWLLAGLVPPRGNLSQRD